MEEKELLNRNRIIILSCILLFIGVVIALVLILNANKKADDDTTSCNKIVLNYRPVSFYTNGYEIDLNDDDIKRLSNILDNLKVSEPIEGVTETKYEIKYCDTTYLIGTDETISKNGSNVKITSGYDDLRKFLEDKQKKINNVYLYNVKDYTTYDEIKLTDEEKNSIKKYWNEQDKKIDYIDLGIIVKYVLVIDDVILSTDENCEYAQYKDGYVILDEGIKEIIKNKTITTDTGNIKYEINNSLGYYNQRYKKRGVYYDTLNQPNAPSYYFIASGEKNTGGYTIKITKVDIDSEGKVIVHIHEDSPKDGEVRTMAFTYPVCSIRFDDNPKSIKFITDNNEELKILNMS